MKQKQGAPPKYNGMVHAIRTVYAEEGLLSFWKGNSANVLRVVPVYSLKFSFNERFRDALKTRPGEKLSVTQKLVAGTASGLMTSLLTYPLETVRTRLALGRAFGSNYSGIYDCFKQTVFKEGVGALYKGIMPTLWTGAPYVGLQMTFYDVFHDTLSSVALRSKALAKSGGDGDGGKAGSAAATATTPATTSTTNVSTRAIAQQEDAPAMDALSALVVKLTAGALAGVMAQSLMFPGDTVRRRMQTNGMNGEAKVYTSSLDCCRKIVEREGIRGFYRGIGVNTFRAMPGAGIQFLAYDSLKAILHAE